MADDPSQVVRRTGLWNNVESDARNRLHLVGVAGKSGPTKAMIAIGLPGIDGYELCGRVRKRRPRSHCVAFSGYGQQSDVRRALEAGFDGHFTRMALT